MPGACRPRRATRCASSTPTSTATPRVVCPPGPWAATWARTRSSSPPRSPPARRWLTRSRAMSAEDRRFEPLGGRTIYEGRIIDLAVERFRYADGDEVEREIVHHQGAAAAVAHDDEHVWLVR